MSKSKLMERLQKSTKLKFVDVLSESELFNHKDQSQTHIPILNVALSGQVDGGLTSGITFVAGESKHFKTGLALIMVSAYLRKHKDGVCIFYDSEFGVTKEYLKANGVDPSRVLHIPIHNVEELKFELVSQLEEINRGDKVIIFVDSLGLLASKKELEDAVDQKSVADMSRAKAITSLMRIITPYFTTKNIPGVIINHTMTGQGAFSKTEMTGGCVVEGTKIVMGDGTTKEIQDVQVGDYVKTLTGSHQVTSTWNPDTLLEGTPECIEVEFEDGYKVVCSETHRFLVMDGDIPKWVEAKDLVDGMDCVRV